jgi:hypothetical protein
VALEAVLLVEATAVDASHRLMDLRVEEVVAEEDKDQFSSLIEPYFHMFPLYSF